ncbi:MAG: hypothetical protein LC105_06155 [Chitinophagales bacterium]|nr:hypothetical protein [Chitinophagales bacterium]
MASVLTSWALKMEDLLSAPASAAQKVVNKLGDAIVSIEKYSNKTGAALVKNLQDEKVRRQELVTKIKEQERVLKENEKILNKSGQGWNAHKQASQNIEDAKNKIEKYNIALEKTEEDIVEMTGRLEDFTEHHKKLDNVAVRWNQLTDLVGKFAQALNFSSEYESIKDNIEMLTDKQGEALTDATKKVYRLSEVYGESGESIAKSANATAMRFGVSYDEALEKIEAGFKKGANLSGDMLSRLEGAQPLIDMGFSLDEVIAKMAILNKKGISTSDAFRSFERANVTLKTMNESTQAALAGVGLLPDDLKGKTVKDAMEIISDAMDASNATAQDKQILMTDLFGRGGRAMGTALKEALQSSAESLDELGVVEDANDKIKGFMADVKSSVASVVGSFAIGLQQLAPVFTGIGSGIGLFKELSKVTWIQEGAIKVLTIAQKGLDLVAKAGPWGWVALAIGAVSLAVGVLSKKFEWAAGIVGGVKNSFMDFGKVLLDIVLLPIKNIINGVGAVGKAIAALMNGDWTGAKNAALGAFDGFKDVWESGKKAGESFSEGYKKGVKELKNKKEKEGSTGTTGVETLNADAQLLDFTSGAKNEDKDKGSKKDGMSISGSGGKSLTMTLNVTNNFNGKINGREDIRQLANEVMSVVNDRARDMALAL